ATAQRTLGQAKVAARHAARTDGSSLAKEFSALRSRRVKTALKDHQGMRPAREARLKALGDKAVDTAADFADASQKQATGNDQTPFKNAKNVARGAQTAREVMDKTLSIAQGLGSAAEIVLDYLEPSTVAEGYLWLTTGQTT